MAMMPPHRRPAGDRRDVMTTIVENFGSGAAARMAGARAALGMPGLVLGASYLGFGALVRQTHLDLPQGLTSPIAGWALPWPIALIEAYAAGGSVLSAALALLLTNTRLVPMVASLLPFLRVGYTTPPRFRHY